MVVHDLDLVGVAVFPDKAYAPLVVDSNTVLPCPIVPQGLEPIARWEAQRVKARCRMQLRKFPPCRLMQCWRQPAYVLPSEDSGGILVCKRLDHMVILTLPVIIDKRERFMTKPAKAALKATPKFDTEKDERAYWESHDSTEHLDWTKARKVVLPNLKPTTKTISLRLPQHLLDSIKTAANSRDVPYQSLIKVWLQEKLRS